MADWKTFWGDAHHNVCVPSDRGAVDLPALCAEARKHLDFLPFAYYTVLADSFRADTNPPGQSGIQIERWKPEDQLRREWAEIEEASRAFHEPGRFVTFPGYEWHGNGACGDHNVYHAREGLPIHRVETLPDLYRRLHGQPALVIPHHTAYQPGHRGREWSCVDETLTPFTEIFSCHGCSETDEEWIGMRQNAPLAPPVGAGTWQRALDRGWHLGAIASTDGYGASKLTGLFGNGLMACLASELTRESLWDAFRARRVYAVTGDRIALDFTVNGQPMGSQLTAKGARRIRVRATGLDAIDRIELLRGSQVIATHCHQGTWAPPAPGRVTRLRLRLELGWGTGFQQLVVPDQPWHGDLELGRGRFLNQWPCWIGKGQHPAVLDGRKASFDMVSTCWQVRNRWQNALVLECEADPADTLTVRINGETVHGPVASFCEESRAISLDRECASRLLSLKGLTPDQTERQDPFYDHARKAKLHRAIPEAGYTAELAVDDDSPLAEEIHYRVRVEQRNGQRAWSSPIWVRHE
jgi:hypothetical protein